MHVFSRKSFEARVWQMRTLYLYDKYKNCKWDLWGADKRTLGMTKEKSDCIPRAGLTRSTPQTDGLVQTTKAHGKTQDRQHPTKWDSVSHCLLLGILHRNGGTSKYRKYLKKSTFLASTPLRAGFASVPCLELYAFKSLYMPTLQNNNSKVDAKGCLLDLQTSTMLCACCARAKLRPILDCLAEAGVPSLDPETIRREIEKTKISWTQLGSSQQ